MESTYAYFLFYFFSKDITIKLSTWLITSNIIYLEEFLICMHIISLILSHSHSLSFSTTLSFPNTHTHKRARARHFLHILSQNSCFQPSIFTFFNSILLSCVSVTIAKTLINKYKIVSKLILKITISSIKIKKVHDKQLVFEVDI